MSKYRIEFVTPLFSRGVYEDQPEVRPASIRGQLHWWFRALGGAATDEAVVFGTVQKQARASKVVVRVTNVIGNVDRINTLPHKGGGQGSPKAAFEPGTLFDLHLLTRVSATEFRLASALNRCIESWLLLGTLGLRSTRGAGSFSWQNLEPSTPDALTPPTSFEAYESRCVKLLEGTQLRFALLSESYPSAEQPRRIVSDTLGGRDDRGGETDLARINYPLGKVFGGRKTSPLRFRIVRVGAEHRIAAIWDDRTAVTGNRPGDLAAIITLLAKRKPALGGQLAQSKLMPRS